MKSRHDQLISERAAEWFWTLEDGGTPEARAAYARWLLESPRHVEEALAIEALYRAYEGFDPDKHIPLGPAPAETNVALLREAPVHRGSSAAVRRWPVRAAISIAASALLGWTLFATGLVSPGTRYATEIGEQRTVGLPDGSVANLNTHSAMQVRFTDEVREIRLLRGEVLFRVAPQPARPFRVVVDRTVIQAVGTQFNVYRRASGLTTISVLEGAVKVDDDGQAPRLTAGAVVQVNSNGQIKPVADIDPAEVVAAWRQRRLKFRGATLAEVVAEFNRYNRTVRLEVSEPEVAQRRLTGQFDADDPASLLAFLADDPSLAFERRGDVTVIRAIRND